MNLLTEIIGSMDLDTRRALAAGIGSILGVIALWITSAVGRLAARGVRAVWVALTAAPPPAPVDPPKPLGKIAETVVSLVAGAIVSPAKDVGQWELHNGHLVIRGDGNNALVMVAGRTLEGHIEPHEWRAIEAAIAARIEAHRADVKASHRDTILAGLIETSKEQEKLSVAIEQAAKSRGLR